MILIKTTSKLILWNAHTKALLYWKEIELNVTKIRPWKGQGLRTGTLDFKVRWVERDWRRNVGSGGICEKEGTFPRREQSEGRGVWGIWCVESWGQDAVTAPHGRRRVIEAKQENTQQAHTLKDTSGFPNNLVTHSLDQLRYFTLRVLMCLGFLLFCFRFWLKQ